MLRLVEETPQAKWASGICPIKIGFTPHKEKSVLPLSHVFFQICSCLNCGEFHCAPHHRARMTCAALVAKLVKLDEFHIPRTQLLDEYSTIVSIISTWFHYISHGNLPRISKKPCRPKQSQSFRASSTAAGEVKTFNAAGLGTRCLNFLLRGPRILFRKKKKKRNGSLGIVEILQIQKVSPATERT